MNLKNKDCYPQLIVIPIFPYSKIVNILKIDNKEKINFLLSILVKYEFNHPINPNISELLNNIFYDYYKNEDNHEIVENIINNCLIELYNLINVFIIDFDNEIYSEIYEVFVNGKNICFYKK